MDEKITIITKERSDAIGIVDAFLLNEFKKQKVNFVHICLSGKGKNFFYTIFLYTISCWKLIKVYRKHRGLIYFSAPDMYAVLLNLFYPFKLCVVTVHHIENPWISKQITQKILNSFDYFIGTSEFSKNQLVNEWGISSKKIFVNYCGISENYYLEYIENFMPYKYLLYVGDEYPRKNLYNIFKAFSVVVKEIPDVKLVKFGKVRSKKTKRIQTDG